MTKAKPHQGHTLTEWIVERIQDPEAAVAYLRENLRREDDMSEAEYRTLLGDCLVNLGAAHGLTVRVDDVQS